MFLDSLLREMGVDIRDGPGGTYLQRNPLKPVWDDVYVAYHFEEQTE